jgi:hypothetical protein
VPEKKFELGDYVEVKDRIARLFEYFPQARIETDYTLTSEPDEKPKVICRAFVYRNPDDEKPGGHGTSWLYLPGSTPYTRGSEIENAETSAVGRAIGMLGILIDKSIATSNEIDNKREPGPAAKQGPPMIRHLDPNSLVGTIELSKDSPDFLPKVSPEGGTLMFKLVSPAGGIKVISHGKLAYDLSMEKDDVIGKLATCFGRVTDEWFMSKGHKVTYQVLQLDRIKVGQLELPEPEPPLEEPPDDVSLIDEAPTAPLGLVE